MKRSAAARMAIGLSLLSGVGVLAPVGNAAPTNKTFVATATVTDSSGAATYLTSGATALVAVTITNTTKQPQSFGSANITPPAGYSICIDPSCAPVIDPALSGFSAPASSSIIEIRSTNTAGVAPGDSVTVVATVTAPTPANCAAEWTVQVKQSNDFSGTGNDFLGNNVSPGSSLVFVTQPTGTQWNVAMSPPAVVGAVNACGSAVSLSGLTVTDAQSQIKTMTLTPTASGTIEIDNLTFSSFGFYDTLTASLLGYPSVTSQQFPVAQQLVSCTSDPCTMTLGTKTVTTDGVTATDGTLGYISGSDLGAPKTDPFPVCTQEVGQAPVGNEVVIDSTRGKTVTTTLSKQLVNSLPNNGKPFMDICLSLPAGSQEFHDKYTGLLTLVGILPDCTSTNQTLCVASRAKNAGNEIIVWYLPLGDPTRMTY